MSGMSSPLLNAFCNSLISSSLLKNTLVASHCLMFFQYCSIGFNSGEYGGNRMQMMPEVRVNSMISFVRCQRPLSTIIHNFLWCLCNRLRNDRNFLLLIFGLSFEVTFFSPIAPNVWIFWNLLRIYLMQGRDPFGYQLLMICGSSLNVASSKNRISNRRLRRALSLRRSFF